MRKLLVLIYIILLALISCESSTETGDFLKPTESSESEYYVKPIEFSESELDVLELVQFNDDMLFFDYNIPEKYKWMSFSFETYLEGEIVNGESVTTGLGVGDHIGKLAVEIIDEDVFKVQIKQIYTDDDFGIASFQILKDDLIKSSKGFSTSYLIEKKKITEEDEIILGVYLYFDESGISRVSPKSILYDKKYVEESDICVIFSLKLLEDFQ